MCSIVIYYNSGSLITFSHVTVYMYLFLQISLNCNTGKICNDKSQGSVHLMLLGLEACKPQSGVYFLRILLSN